MSADTGSTGYGPLLVQTYEGLRRGCGSYGAQVFFLITDSGCVSDDDQCVNPRLSCVLQLDEDPAFSQNPTVDCKSTRSVTSMFQQKPSMHDQHRAAIERETRTCSCRTLLSTRQRPLYVDCSHESRGDRRWVVF